MKKNRIWILLVVAFSLLLCSGSLYADEEQGFSTEEAVDSLQENESTATFDLLAKEEIPESEGNQSQEVVAPEMSDEINSPVSSFQAIAPALLTNEIVVTNFTDFRNAIQTANNGYTTIYLGGDIVMSSGVTIPSNKANLIIDGTNPNTGIRHTLTDFSSVNITDSINISANTLGASTITLRNVNIQGKHYLGTVCVSGNLGITVLYDNVTYSGPQISYNRSGKVIYRNSTITIPTTVVGGTASEQVGEVNSVDFEGNVTINHTPSGPTFPIFSFYNSGEILTFKQNSNVQITTINGLNAQNSGITAVVFENNAKLTATQTANNMSFFSGLGQTFEMRTGSSMTLTRTMSTTSVSAIWMDSTTGSFTMTGANMSIKSTGAVSTTEILNIPKPALTDSALSIETQGNQAVRSIYGRGNLSLTNSTMSTKVSGSETETSTRTTFDFTGSLISMSNSTINIAINNSTNGGFIAANRVTLLNSNINSTITGLISNTGTADLVVGDISLDNSKIIGSYANNSGGLLRATSGTTTDIVAKNASVIQSTATGASATVVYAGGTLSMQTGSRLFIDIGSATANNSYPVSVGGTLSFLDNTLTNVTVRAGVIDGALRLRSTATTFTVTNPKALVVYAPTASKVLSSSTSVNFTLTTQQINQWTTVNTPTTSGTLDHPPNKRFSKADTSNYVIQGINASGNTGGTTVTSSNYVSADGLNPLNNLSFLSSDSKIMSMGKMSASVTPLSQYATSATGVSEPNGNVRLNYKSGGTNMVANGLVDSSGNYVLSLSSLDASGYTLMANWNYLYYNVVGNVTPISGNLQFINVPVLMDFGSTKIPMTTKILQRSNSSWNIQIQDNRTATANWQLLVQVSVPLTPADNTKPSIANAFIFVDTGNGVHNLSTTPYTIQTNKGGSQNTTVSWANNQGLLLRINPGKVYSGTAYKGTLLWTLQDAP